MKRINLEHAHAPRRVTLEAFESGTASAYFYGFKLAMPTARKRYVLAELPQAAKDTKTWLTEHAWPKGCEVDDGEGWKSAPAEPKPSTIPWEPTPCETRMAKGTRPKDVRFISKHPPSVTSTRSVQRWGERPRNSARQAQAAWDLLLLRLDLGKVDVLNLERRYEYQYQTGKGGLWTYRMTVKPKYGDAYTESIEAHEVSNQRERGVQKP
jgi:hypothetical protein